MLVYFFLVFAHSRIEKNTNYYYFLKKGKSFKKLLRDRRAIIDSTPSLISITKISELIMGNWLLSPEVLLGIIVAVLSMIVFFFERFVPRRIRIKELWFYPIKSCCGVSVQEAVTSRTGLKFDRMFMIVDRNMRFVTQRSFPKLALVHIRMNPNQASLTVHSEGVEASVVISLEPQQQQEYQNTDQELQNTTNANDLTSTLRVNIWGDEFEAVEVSKEASLWFDNFLRVEETESRDADPCLPEMDKESKKGPFRLVRLINERKSEKTLGHI